MPSTASSSDSASVAGWAVCRSPVCRRASAGGQLSPPSSCVPPSCGCSTNRMPGSTPRAERCWTRWSGRRRRREPPCCWLRTRSSRLALLRRVPKRWPEARCGRRRRANGRPSVWHDTTVVAGKDLRIELRSRVATNQVAPFALLVLILFAFALDPDRGVLDRAAAGLFWIAVLFSALLAVQRAFALEAGEGTRDALRLSGLDPAAIFLGKAGAVAVELLALEAVLGAGVVVLYDRALHGPVLLVVTCVLATVGLAAAGTIYSALAAGLRVR